MNITLAIPIEQQVGHGMRQFDPAMKPAEYKVLVVDDDPAMVRLLSRWLIKAGYTVRTATDGQEALDAIELECPDFLVTDWEMPRMDGLELCRRVRETVLPHYVYIVFLTVRTGAAEMITGLENGADDFLTKPVAEAELLARMRASSRVLELERRLSLLAHTDAMTGLVTQRTFYEALDKEWRRCRRSHAPLSCAMADLDFFKQVNDVHGHPAGDSVLKVVSELLVDACRASDTVCRYGGEEFCVMLPETSEQDAMVWADRVRQRLASLQVPAGIKDLHITASFGVAECRDDTQTSEELVDLADQALLCAKRISRDRVVAYSSLIDAVEGTVRGDELDEVFAGRVAGDVMNPLVVCLHEKDTIADAAGFLLQSGMASTPVLTAEGALAGFLSEKDLMTAMILPHCWQRPLAAAMRPNVICYEEDTPVRLIYEFLCRVSIRAVVITRRGRPTGTISRRSLLQWFRNWVICRDAASSARASSSPAVGGSKPGTASEPSLRTPCNEPAGLLEG
ncbi:MAG: diguanylate cyclase [Thermoguttaceae bacterium]